MQGSYDPRTVILSFLIAWFAAFVAIQLAGRIRGATTQRLSLWVWAGGIALGLGIWSMHFMGMLAFRLPVPMFYDVRLTALSVAPGVLASVLALYIASTRQRSLKQLLVAAGFMAIGICGMHYLGMAAITFTPGAGYSPFWVLASIVVAWAVSLVALQVLTRFSWLSSEPRFGAQVAAAALMGLGVCGMHYTGMAALRIDATTFCIARPGAVPGEQLSLIIVSIALMYLAAITILSQRDLYASEKRFRALIEGAPGAMVIVDARGMIGLVNAEAERLFGYRRDELDGQHLRKLVAQSRQHAIPDFHDLQLSHRASFGSDGELRCRRKDDGEFPAELALNPLLLQGQRITIASVIDLTERQRNEERIARLAYFDGLTGLPNRSRFQQRLNELLARGPAYPFGLMFADLDGFKEVNDSLGHSAGDRVLVQFAQRLREAVGERGEVFRFGGDEFIVLLPGRDETSDDAVAEELIRSAAAPMRMEGEQLVLTLSLGSVRHPEHGDGHDVLLKRADNALYHAKAAGKNLHLRFHADMEESVTRHFTLLNELRQAEAQGQLTLLYQPVVRLDTRQIIGAEALVYWNHPVHGRITPSTFIPVAEDSGLIESLGEWVLFEAVRQSAAWRTQGLPPLRMAVNVSGIQFRNVMRLREAVDRALHQHDYPASGLELEITERQIMHDPETSIATMRALGELGISIALDDFGTGYSSLSHLRQFPLHKLKIDRSFTDQIDRDPAGLAIVHAVAELGHNLGMIVVAEGIEREVQVDPLQACHCREAQGYLFGRPMPAARFEQLLAAPALANGSHAGVHPGNA